MDTIFTGTQKQKSCYYRSTDLIQAMTKLRLTNLFTDALPGDVDVRNMPRQVMNACYSWVSPKGMKEPELIIHSQEVANLLQLENLYIQGQEFSDIMTGNKIADGSKPHAMCYGGHQFGHWAGQLGDGRAINLGEVGTSEGHMSLQLKGAGPTPYSRTADGLAVLRSSIREFLCSEAMFHLGVPTTRALSLCLTGEVVLRDMMYDGNAAYEKGAVVCRVAPSFIRFGNFEILTSRNDIDTLTKLVNFTISQHFPHLNEKADKYLNFFKEVADKTCEMIVHWQRVGFVHGVMNTDNMSVLGLTIDYGPYGWMDNFDPDWTPNTTDLPGKRYRFGNQPVIAQWNLLKLANAIHPLINDEESLKNIIQHFKIQYNQSYLIMIKSKLGLFEIRDGDESLIFNLEQILKETEIDMTIFFRNLVQIQFNINDHRMFEIIHPALYAEVLEPDVKTKIILWLTQYRERLKSETKTPEARIKKMNEVNPKYVLRNYMAQMAIDEAEKGNYHLVYEMYEMLKKPYDQQPEFEKWFARRPDWARKKVGCSMLSCSS